MFNYIEQGSVWDVADRNRNSGKYSTTQNRDLLGTLQIATVTQVSVQLHRIGTCLGRRYIETITQVGIQLYRIETC